MAKSNWWNRNPQKIDDSEFKSKRDAKKQVKQNSRKQVSEVYRYFENEEHAAAFVKGEIFISTLKRCREYEDPLQGDREEGYERYNTGRRITGNGSDPAFVAMAAKAGIYVGPDSIDMTIENNELTTFLHDAYVLCTTLGFSAEDLTETFGKYCVKIKSIDKFHSAITRSLASSTEISQAARGEVIYKERFYKEFEDSPGLIGFVKPPDKYSTQKEYRFLWCVPVGVEISGLVVRCPDVVNLVTRIR
ncbi:hypothetical protein ABFV51_26025 [Pseudomonas asgharzadehiana]|uniref:hypothetical protein n=1 Tax=Pseudomonas asgharzadehiana TaxID=2842349 RepID=UPI0034D79AEA